MLATRRSVAFLITLSKQLWLKGFRHQWHDVNVLEKREILELLSAVEQYFTRLRRETKPTGGEVVVEGGACDFPLVRWGADGTWGDTC